MNVGKTLGRLKEVFIVAVVFIILGVHYNNYSAGRDGEDFEVTCVKGQTVMVSEFTSKMSAYNALTPNGGPVACQGPYKAQKSVNPFYIDGDDWEAKCFSGQRVFQANYGAKQATVMALTPDGKPQSCLNEQSD